nr:hypothetical protein [Bacilli bacterium]
ATYGDSVDGSLSVLALATSDSSHSTDTYKDAFGDLNLFFSNTNSNKSFEVEMNLDYVHGSSLSEADDGIVVKIGNGFHYATWNWGYHSGKSYLLFKSNNTYNGTDSNNKMTHLDPNDNSADYAEVIPTGKTFTEEFLEFAKDTHIVIKFKYDSSVSSNNIYCTITYYTNVEGYEQYFGYTQTFAGTITSEEQGWNEVNALRVYRTTANSTLSVESIKYYGPLDTNSSVNGKILKKENKSKEDSNVLNSEVITISSTSFISF